MSKELTKFQATYKKLAPKVKVYTKKNAQDLSRQVKSAFQSANFHGEEMIAEAMANARDNGVTGDKYADFIKDKGFQDAIKVFDKAVGLMDTPQKELKKFCAQAAQTADELAVLHTQIEKDLKKRKDKSDTKKDIEKLRDQINADWQAVTAASKEHSELPQIQQEEPSKQLMVGLKQATVRHWMRLNGLVKLYMRRQTPRDNGLELRFGSCGLKKLMRWITRSWTPQHPVYVSSQKEVGNELHGCPTYKSFLPILRISAPFCSNSIIPCPDTGERNRAMGCSDVSGH